MKNDILLYPSLNDELLNRIRFQAHAYEFYYTDRNDDEFELVSEPMEALSSIYSIRDDNGIWTQDDYNLCFKRKYCLRTFQCLFGPEGIACDDAELGLAVQWTSADSKQRGMIKIGTFSKKQDIFEANVEYHFEKAQLRGEVIFNTILYIATSGKQTDSELHLINHSGYILGQLDTYVIKLDGSSSTFPVFEVSEPGQPLWYVKCDWIDPTADAFSEYVSINLNTAHKNYKYIDREQKTYDPQLLSEIMSSAITLIIEKLRMEGELTDILNNENIEPGSVGQAVLYFSNTLEWNLESPEAVSLSARKFFDQRM